MANQDEARKAVSGLFKATGIVRVVCVDDVYFHSAGIEEVIGVCQSVDPTFAASVVGLESIPFDEDFEIWRDALRQVWEKLGEAERIKIYRRLLSGSGKDKEEDLQSVSVLEELLRDFDFQGLAPKDWNENKEALLRESDAKKTLFLFDRDLSLGGGTTDGGIGLIQEVSSSALHSEAMCGLISHTFTPEAEYTTWQSLARDHKLGKDSFVPISKGRLMEEPLSFARMLKLTILSKPCHNLKDRVRKIISDSLDEAREELDAISVWDFEHIVFTASNDEGTWEPDTLFRLFSMFHREATLSKSRTDTDLREITSKIRDISVIFVDSEALPSESWKIQRREIYLDNTPLNAHFMPIELGDIFETTNNGGKRFILLAQPCDLMVRKSGVRHRDVIEVTLAEVLPDLPEKAKGKPAQYELYYELPYFDKGSPKSHYVGFRQRHSVRLNLLDLCSYRTDGCATFGHNDDCPVEVIPAWKQHHKIIRRYFARVLKGYGDLQTAMTAKSVTLQIIDEGTIPLASNSKIFPVSIDSERKVIVYDCKRIARLSQPRAGALLTQFSSSMSRAAFDKDFGRRNKDTMDVGEPATPELAQGGEGK